MNPEIGSKLREARLGKDLTLEEISEQLHIRVAYLKSLESGLFDQLPSLTQAKGFIRTYAKFLELDFSSLLEEQLVSPLPATDLQENNSPEVEPKEDDRSHLLIFKEIGDTIHQRRDIIGLSKEDIEAHTHIPAHYIDYIETGDFDAFPSPAQARGMLSNYLQFLELNPDDLLNKYAEALQIRLTRRQVQSSESEEAIIGQPASRKSPRPPPMGADVLVTRPDSDQHCWHDRCKPDNLGDWTGHSNPG